MTLGRTVSVSLGAHNEAFDAAWGRSAAAAEAATERVAKSVRGAAVASAQAAADMGAGVDEQIAAAARGAASWMDYSDTVTRAQRAVGAAAERAARDAGQSVDQQAAAYQRGIAAMREYESAQQKAADEAAVAADKVKAAAAEQAAAVKAAAAEQSAAADRSLASFERLGKWTATGVVAGLAASTYGAVKLQSSMERLQTQAGASTNQVKSLTSGVLDMAGKVGESPDQLASGMYHVVSSLNATLPASKRVSTELSVLKIAAEGAKLGGADLTDTTNALDAAVVSGISGVQNYHQAMGALNAVVGAGDMKMQDLADALGTGLLGPMKAYGVSLKDVGGALAVFGDNNMRGQEAATKLQSAIRIMAAPSAEAVKALSAIGMSSTEMADDIRKKGLVDALADLKKHLEDSGATASQQALIITRAFGGRQATGVELLLSQLDRLKAKTEEVGKGATTFSTSYSEYNRTLSAQWDKAKAGIEAEADKIGTALIPDLQKLMGVTADVVGWMEKHRAEADLLAGAIGLVLGGAVTVFAVQKAQAFKKAMSDMWSATSTMIGWAKRLGSQTEQTGGQVVEAGETMQASNATTGASFEAVGAAAGTEGDEVDSSIGSMVTAVEAGNEAIQASNATTAASFEEVGAAAEAASAEVDAAGVTSAGRSIAGAAGGALTDVGIFAAAAGAAGLLLTGDSGVTKTYAEHPPGAPQISAPNAGESEEHYIKRTLGLPDHWKGGKLTAASYTGANVDHKAVDSFFTWLNQIGTFGKNGFTAYSASTGIAHVTPTSFAEAMLASLGAKATTSNIADLTAWEADEGGNWHNSAKYNPLNTKRQMNGSRNVGGGIQAYKSWTQGLEATMESLTNGDYSAIIAALKNGGVSVSKFDQILQASKWGTTLTPSQGTAVSTKQLDAINNTLKQLESKQSSTLADYLNSIKAGTAASTATIPAAVGTMLATAQALVGTKYTWGGGHDGWDSVAELKKIGVDCSGFVSAVLHSGGVTLNGPQTTDGLPNYLSKGAGKYVTVYDRANDGGQSHTLIDILGKWFEAGGNSKYNPKGGVSQLTAAQAEGELAGGGFKAYHPDIKGNGGGSGGEESLLQEIQASAVVLTATYRKLIQDGSTRSLENSLGVSTGGIGGKLSADWAAGRGSAAERLLARSMSGSVQQTDYRLLVDELRSTHVKALEQIADKLVAAHKAALSNLSSDLYSAWVTDMATMTDDVVASMQSATATMVDAMNAAATAIKDRTSASADASSATVQAIQDASKIATDTLAERGLYGLNLVAQQQQVVLDAMSAKYDQQIAAAKQAVDRSQTRTDGVTARAQAHLDKVTDQQNAAIQRAQRAVENSAGGTKAQQTRAEAQLTAAQAVAKRLEQQAQDALDKAQGSAQMTLATANQALQSAQNQAQESEAQQQAIIDKTKAEASTQFAGTGLTVNITGIPTTDAGAIASEVGWVLRTQVPANA